MSGSTSNHCSNDGTTASTKADSCYNDVGTYVCYEGCGRDRDNKLNNNFVNNDGYIQIECGGDNSNNNNDERNEEIVRKQDKRETAINNKRDDQEDDQKDDQNDEEEEKEDERSRNRNSLGVCPVCRVGLGGVQATQAHLLQELECLRGCLIDHYSFTSLIRLFTHYSIN